MPVPDGAPERDQARVVISDRRSQEREESAGFIALFCQRFTAWLLAALGRREAPSPTSGPMDSPHDESWAADRSRRRFATLDDLMDLMRQLRDRVDSQNRQGWHARSTRFSAHIQLGGKVGLPLDS